MLDLSLRMSIKGVVAEMQLPFLKANQMKHILILATILILGCTKEETKCTPYNLVTESSENSARQKCNGIANSHPEFKVISSNYIGCLTKDEYTQAKKGESQITRNYCNGVFYTVKITLK